MVGPPHWSCPGGLHPGAPGVTELLLVPPRAQPSYSPVLLAAVSCCWLLRSNNKMEFEAAMTIICTYGISFCPSLSGWEFVLQGWNRCGGM